MEAIRKTLRVCVYVCVCAPARACGRARCVWCGVVMVVVCVCAHARGRARERVYVGSDETS